MNDAAREALLKAQAWVIAACEADPRLRGVIVFDDSDISLYHKDMTKQAAWGWRSNGPDTLSSVIEAFERAYDPPAGEVELASWHVASPLDPRDPDYSRDGIFVHHNCWKCGSGATLCITGNPNVCIYPRARND